MADAKAAADKAKADKLAAAKAAEAKAKADAEKAEKAKQAKIEKANPERYWVQVAGGANKATLPKAWAALVEKSPKLLAGRSPSSVHYRFTNRLMIGPFKSESEAQAWVNTAAKAGFSSFPVTTQAGEVVDKVATK